MLATKQPAMTAATLAAILRERRGTHRLDEIVDFTAAIVRSQIAAAIANVTFVALGCAVFDRLWYLTTGRTYLDPHDAQHVFETLSPLTSLTVLYAAETGVLLWLGSVAGGWFENWALYRKLPRIVAAHPLGARVGRERLRRFSEALARNASGWGTNVALGFLLGMTPAFGRFFGLPLDVRHVTLSTGTLALAAADLEPDKLFSGRVLAGAAGIAVMFVLNLSVSFFLSLASAARAYGLPRRDVVALLGRMVRRFLTRPQQFLLPPRRRAAAPREEAAHA
jgi:site-specific recombinase